MNTVDVSNAPKITLDSVHNFLGLVELGAECLDGRDKISIPTCGDRCTSSPPAGPARSQYFLLLCTAEGKGGSQEEEEEVKEGGEATEPMPVSRRN
jgi:hypothetical protein